MEQIFNQDIGRGTMDIVCSATELCKDKPSGTLQNGTVKGPCGTNLTVSPSHPRWEEYLGAIATLSGVPAVCKACTKAHIR